VAYAAEAGQVALDGTGENSPFLSALIKYIETPGPEVNFLFRKVRDDVLAATERRQEHSSTAHCPPRHSISATHSRHLCDITR
jgi:uncharacterized caspase-like protein